MILRQLTWRRLLNQKRYVTIDQNPNSYKAKRAWPPQFAKLPQNYQLRLERRFRRRVKLKWARPRLMKYISIAQFISVVGIVIYGVFFMELNDAQGDNPFGPLRQWCKRKMDSFWTYNTLPPAFKSNRSDKDR